MAWLETYFNRSARPRRRRGLRFGFCVWALAGAAGPCSLGIRVVAEKERAKLNYRYRDRDHPTNVLSFPMDLPVELGRALEYAIA